jgi:glutamyl-tRNA synthetase
VVRGNLLLPDDADALVRMLIEDELAPDDAAAAVLAQAGGDFYARASAAWAVAGGDFATFARTVAVDTGRKGAALYQPLRAALTGMIHGPELAPLVALLGEEIVTARLRAAARRASGT